MLFAKGVLLLKPGEGLWCFAAVLVLVLGLGLAHLVLVGKEVAVVERAWRSDSAFPPLYGLPCLPC